jgi:hypothetical protein
VDPFPLRRRIDGDAGSISTSPLGPKSKASLFSFKILPRRPGGFQLPLLAEGRSSLEKMTRVKEPSTPAASEPPWKGRRSSAVARCRRHTGSAPARAHAQLPTAEGSDCKGTRSRGRGGCTRTTRPLKACHRSGCIPVPRAERWQKRQPKWGRRGGASAYGSYAPVAATRRQGSRAPDCDGRSRQGWGLLLLEYSSSIRGLRNVLFANLGSCEV